VSSFLHHVALAAPLFLIVLPGHLLALWGGWTKPVSDALGRFVFGVALPALLFRLMSDLSQLPPVDARLLIAFFGGCLIVFALGRLIGASAFRLDGVAQSVFALGGVFSNKVLLGVPLAKLTLGEAAMPAVALVLVFNALVLWTLVTVSVERARHGSLSLAGLGKTTRSVLTNPIVAGILSGAAFGLTGWQLPGVIDEPLRLIGQAAAPLALVVVGMGLAQYGVRAGWREGAAISLLKLVVQPLVGWLLARALGLSIVETQAVALLASLAVGVNVYLMAQQFGTMEAPVATSMVFATALAALTVPLVPTLLGAAPLAEP
jgi:predicted permease